MKKRNKLFIVLLVLALSMSLTIPAFAASSVSSVTADCEGVRFVGYAEPGEIVTLEVRLHDTSAWQSPTIQDDYIVLSVTGPFDVFVPWVANPDGRLGRGFVDVNGVDLNPGFEDILDCPPPPGGEGCTPGYWKNHLEDWPPTGFSPFDDFDTEFGVNYFDPDITLDEAVNAKGGGVKKLARHGTAALLSAAHPDVAYPYSVGEVIAFVQDGDAGTLADANELGCEIP